MGTSRWQTGLFGGLAMAITAPLVAGWMTAPALAASQAPPGNNGTIKVDEAAKSLRFRGKITDTRAAQSRAFDVTIPLHHLIGHRLRGEAEPPERGLLHLGRQMRQRADRARELAHRAIGERGLEPPGVAGKLLAPEQALEAEGDRLGVDAMGPSDHRRAPMALGQRPRCPPTPTGQRQNRGRRRCGPGRSAWSGLPVTCLYPISRAYYVFVTRCWGQCTHGYFFLQACH